MTAAVALGAAAAVTWLLRVSLIAVFPASRLPAVVHDSLRHVGPAVLAALVTASLHSAPDGAAPWPFLAAAVAAAAVAWRWRSTVATVAVGLAVLSLLQPLAS